MTEQSLVGGGGTDSGYFIMNGVVGVERKRSFTIEPPEF